MSAKSNLEHRRLRFESPLGPDKLRLESFAGLEELSRPFRFELALRSPDHALAAADIVGKPVAFQIWESGGATRHFHGMVSRFSAGELIDREVRRYHAVVVPWFWFLSKRSACRIFQQKSVIDIAEQIFDELGFSDYDKSNVRSDLPQLEYSVQYRESDLDFLSRLFEEAGIFYFFRHEEKKHTLVLADTKVAYFDCKPHDIACAAGTLPKDHVTAWEHRWQFVSGAWMHSDYNFETPQSELRSSAKSLVDLPGSEAYEVYEHPGRFADGGTGDGLARLRIEQEEAGWDVVAGSSTCRTFLLGGRFKLDAHSCESETKKEYVLISISHTGHDSSIGGGGGGEDYSNRFQCIPSSVVFRPARATRKPTIAGPQTALVVGPGGEEIYSDAHGRIKVQFHWDREGKKDENSSCWVRVAQSWAGKSWGTIFLPRIGQEVVVEFLEGDPDRPLVIGSVYNATQTPPYELPANQMKSGIKTRSTKGGDPETFNELRFEDKKDSELVYFHAQKDQNVVVENDQKEEIGHDQTVKIGNDQSITVGANRTEEIGKDRELKVGENKTEDVTKNKSVSVGGDHSENITGEMSLSVGKGRTDDVGKDYSISVADNTKLSSGKATTVSVGKNMDVSVEDAMTLSVAKDCQASIDGASTVTVAKEFGLEAKEIMIEGKDQVTIKSGSATITLKKNGDITIKGNNIQLKADGDIILKGSKITQN